MITQEALDQMVAHFSQPDVELGRDNPSAMESCAYRGANGSRCAVGCLIPDELYHPDFEGSSGRMFSDAEKYQADMCIQLSGSALERASAIGLLFGGVDTQFIVDAQVAHDEAHTVQDFLSDLQWVAKKHNLRWPS